ncbi:ABC transporter permease subunit [Salininema proteolyticum]|uniref:ABC transporter permease subunit n=1 Tax=Salininema proteolyticum TaxID=1607685 RepID=A0ABV8U0S7_9ACTN
MRLFRAEISRVLRRRLTWILAIGAFAVPLVVAVMLSMESRTEATDAERAQAEQEWQRLQDDVEKCKEDPEAFFIDWGYPEEHASDMTESECEMELSWANGPEDFLYVYTFDLSEEGRLLIANISLVGALAAMVLAASAIGAEWSSGGMSNLLLWHPNRWKVYAAKCAAAVGLSAVYMAAYTAAVFGIFYLVAELRGTMGEMDSAWWSDMNGTLVRTAVLGVFAALVGATFTFLGKHTALTGGVVIGGLVLSNIAGPIITAITNPTYPDLLSPSYWLDAWSYGETELWPANGTIESMNGTEPEKYLLTWDMIGIGMLIVALVLVVLSSWSFRRRDIA